MPGIIQPYRFTVLGGGGGIPVFEEAGAGNSSAPGAGAQTLDIAYPSTVNANDILILHEYARNGSAAITLSSLPGSFAEINNYVLGVDNPPRSFASRLSWLRASGSETGTVTIGATFGKTPAVLAGRMYRFSGVIATGTPYENANRTGVGSRASTISQGSITTVGSDRLCAHFLAIVDENISTSDFTGETGGNFAEALAEYGASPGEDVTLQMQTATMASAGTISGGSFSVSIAARYARHVFALIPA